MLNPENSLKWAVQQAGNRVGSASVPQLPQITVEERANLIGGSWGNFSPEKSEEDPSLDPKQKPIQEFGSARSELSGLGYTLIPAESLRAIGKIFQEGQVKYKSGAANARNIIPVLGNHSWQYERAEHAMDHLLKFFSGDESEDHLAKVAWFCTIMREIVRLEKEKGLPHAFSSGNV